MNTNEFFRAREELAAACLTVLEDKGKDYAGNAEENDRLGNFKMIAGILAAFSVDSSTPLGVWSVYFLKHVFAILAYAGQHTESEPILGRFVDARNYLDLGYGLVKEGVEAESVTMLSFPATPTQAPDYCICDYTNDGYTIEHMNPFCAVHG